VVVPTNANITGPDNQTCSNGFRIDYYVYGGTPPYTVQSTFPTAVTIVNNVVTRSGSFFEAVTNGTCVNPLVFTIADAAGKQVQSTLQNVPGTQPPAAPTPPPALVLSPLSTTSTRCTGATFNVVVAGGVPPYNVVASPAPPAVVSPMVLNTPGSVAITGLTTGSGTYTVTALDAFNQALTATITCS
jgi:hypothetical protein